jgi:hypothetical protein
MSSETALVSDTITESNPPYLVFINDGLKIMNYDFDKDVWNELSIKEGGWPEDWENLGCHSWVQFMHKIFIVAGGLKLKE